MERKWFFLIIPSFHFPSVVPSCFSYCHKTQTDIVFHFYLFDFTFTLSYFGLQHILFLCLFLSLSQFYFSSHYLTNYKLFSTTTKMSLGNCQPETISPSPQRYTDTNSNISRALLFAFWMKPNSCFHIYTNKYFKSVCFLCVLL